MSFRARILLVGDDADAAETLAGKLQLMGFDTFRSDSTEGAAKLAREQEADIVIVSAGVSAGSNSGCDLKAAFAMTGELKSSDVSAQIPVILIGPKTGAEDEAQGFAAGANVYLSRPYHDEQLNSRLRSLVRLVTMREELERRAATAAKYGITDDTFVAAADNSEPEILVVAHNTDDFQKIEEILSRVAKLSYAWSPDAALDYLVRRQYDGVIISVDKPEECVRLCGDIRRNSSLFNKPLLVVADRDRFDDPELPFAAGASDLIYRPLQGVELVARIRSFVHEERYRMAMIRIYREAKHYLTSDALTGLYSFGFAVEHLAREIEHAEKWQKNLTVGVFNIRNMTAVNEQYGHASGDRLIRQIGNLVGIVVRGEDMAARLGGQEFCVILPDTGAGGARHVIQRISGVVNATDYYLPEEDEPVSLRVRSGNASFEPGDTPEGMLARARAAME